jgi:bifunctional DNase/RNase
MTEINKITLYPHGLAFGSARFRPAMIFKDKKETEVLPVWLDPVDAGLILAGSHVETRATGAHKASLKIFDALKVKLVSVYFDEMLGSTQYATVTVLQGKKRAEVRVRAAELMSLAINAQCEFFTNLDVIEKSRRINLEWTLGGDGSQLTEKRYEGIH